MKSKIIIAGILLISVSNMMRIGSAFATIAITDYIWFQWLEIISLGFFILVEALIAHDASKSLAMLATQTKKLIKMQLFIFRFQYIGLIFLGSVFPIVGGVVWVAMTNSHPLNLLWTIPILACVPVAVALHGMSDIILPKAPSKPKKGVREQVVVDLFTNNQSPIDIADKHNITVENVEIIQNELSEKFS